MTVPKEDPHVFYVDQYTGCFKHWKVKDLLEELLTIFFASSSSSSWCSCYFPSHKSQCLGKKRVKRIKYEGKSIFGCK
uniref:Uncharacterized protein n=1 Tax=Helianthus annuus TaxID=4232 RepID=A0A251TL34_HELAN